MTCFCEVLEAATREGRIGYDIEFGKNGPHIMGFASRELLWGGAWDAALVKQMLACALDGKFLISAYSGITADRPETEEYTSVKTPLNIWSDNLLKFFLCHPNFAAAPGKDEDDDDAGALGLYNLWACTSMYLDTPNHKQCRGIKCSGPCPSFKKRPDCSVPAFEGEVYYCALDAWTGLLCDYALIDEMKKLEIPDATYNHLAARTEYCWRMQKKGVPVDHPFVQVFDAALKKKKLELFPFETRPCYSKPSKPRKDGSPGKPPKLLKKVEKVYLNAPFNPNAPKAANEWFESKGIILRDRGGKASMSKGIVVKKLNQLLKRYGAEFDTKANDVLWPEDVDVPEISEELELLIRVAQLKGGGKGLKSWFDDKYLKPRLLNASVNRIVHEAHPRVNTIGASTARLSGSNPNFMNIPKRGLMAAARNAIIAFPGCKLSKFDYSQGELRVCLWYAGSNPNDADGVFEQMVADAGPLYDRAAKLMSGTPRDVAKSVSHASNYCEGLSLRSASDTMNKTALAERKAGALIVYDGSEGRPVWKYRNKIVCFTGGNLAERLFGDRTRENRRLANDLRLQYFAGRPELIEWQMRLTHDTQWTRIMRSASGKIIRLLGTAEDDFKLGMAYMGQNGLAEYCQEVMERFGVRNDIANIQCHDELVFCDTPADWSNDDILHFYRPTVEPSKILEGFTCPTEIKAGRAWGETSFVGKLRYTGWPIDTDVPQLLV